MKCVFVSLIIETIIIIQSSQHFIPPLPHCVVAEICNHTKVKVCGEDTKKSEHRIFHDQCDMFELNCDADREFKQVDYSACYQQTRNGVPVNIYSSRRRYDKKVLEKMKKEMAEAKATVTLKRFRLKHPITLPVTTATTNITAVTSGTLAVNNTFNNITTIIPVTLTVNNTSTNITTITPVMSISTVILKKETVWRNGKLVMKIVKGMEHENPRMSNESSEYLSVTSNTVR
ncbi:uncharacterized protein LOC125233065 [Leguminivora glycinivorella]|uniref:uncharacterized protein LOC125233065 n=1 Tax=Leguminivora glycinivorella TaxID=1035111 RepID=UPI00200E7505|nr:uncharacterized protein LOC125233065 [Leguminivora glycinivorella]